MNGTWRKPVIGGRQKKELKMYFKRAGVPWIYEPERPAVHETSAYNKKPKGTKFRNNYEVRLTTVRKNLSTMEERVDKMRMERLETKKPTEDEAHMLGVYKALNTAQIAGTY